MTLKTPVANTSVVGTTAFRWQPQAFAQSYDIEIYRNDDTTFSTANKVASANGVRTAAYVPLTTLPASPEFYLWQVRRTDAAGNKGPWSAAGRFKITPGEVNLLSPALGGSTSPNGAVLQWSRRPGAATYGVTLTAPSGLDAVVHDRGHRLRTDRPTSSTGTGTSGPIAAKDASGNTIGVARCLPPPGRRPAPWPPSRPVHRHPGPARASRARSVTTAPPGTWSPGGVECHHDLPVAAQRQPPSTGATSDVRTRWRPADFGKVDLRCGATGKAPGYLDGVTDEHCRCPTTSGDAVTNVTPRLTISRFTGRRGQPPDRQRRGAWSDVGRLADVHPRHGCADGVPDPQRDRRPATRPSQEDRRHAISIFRVTA